MVEIDQIDYTLPIIQINKNEMLQTPRRKLLEGEKVSETNRMRSMEKSNIEAQKTPNKVDLQIRTSIASLFHLLFFL